MAFDMQLVRLELTNYRKFKHYSIDFDGQMIVLVGENGSGETSILSAAGSALGEFVTKIASHGRQPIAQADAHICQYEVDGAVNQQKQLPVIVAAGGIVGEDRKAVSWSRSLDSEDDQTRLLQHDELEQAAFACSKRLKAGDPDLILPVIINYGTSRLWNGGNTSPTSKDTALSRKDGYRGVLDASFDERQLLAWFYKMTAQDVQRSQRLKPMGGESSVRGGPQRRGAMLPPAVGS